MPTDHEARLADNPRGSTRSRLHPRPALAGRTWTPLAFTMLLLLSGHAGAAWPPDWPFLKADEGWFFYKEPLRPKRPEIVQDRAMEPEPAEVLPPAPDATREPPPESQEESGDLSIERENGSPTGTLIFTVEGPSDLQVAPVSGPQLDTWLLAVTDRDLERLVTAAPAAALRAWIPILLDQALTVLDRTAVRKYLLAQKESLRRSERFSKLWEEVIWTDPAFDRPGHLPTGSLAQTIYEEDRASQRKATLAAARGSISLLAVLGPECAACEAQWTILTRWSAASGITVRPIARTLVTLSDSTVALPYPRVIDQLGVTQVPSLYLVEPSSGYLTRLGAGLLSDDEITTRILRLLDSANRQQQGDSPHVRLSPDAVQRPTRISADD